MKINWSKWEAEIPKHFKNISISSSLSVIEHIGEKDFLCVSRCSATKPTNIPNKTFTPKELYISSQNKNFYLFCEHNKASYGILSDEHGIVFWNEKINWYDKHPNKLQEKDFKILGEQIAKKM